MPLLVGTGEGSRLGGEGKQSDRHLYLPALNAAPTGEGGDEN